ncbi:MULTISPECIES: DNA repair protein RecO [unclassified Pseudoxanthomonas]|uniref:DNA repair protein RecO n=1 Tax=unclassified Pseudoxanthomonas TaxID=2645906 RepID=UPI0008F42A60|nr:MULTISPECIES: DNA repair protein RecO [unclassified Pseudoxanthomonas]PPJ42381.1 DNA repair protein RecO [Pseudoxanthomonas sp. KAs_5_3]SFV27530.1 DNA replication and repair protein RecO [Pseudoxanthomonas sp. YR558]
MRITGETAFVLHARPWRETSLLVEVLGNEHGRIGLVARGVQGPKKHVLRAALQPLQCIRLDVDLRGELGRLVAAEALDAAPQPAGDAMLAAFYLNELVLRLAPRHDPLPALFEAYADAREGLRLREGLAWTLRRFERDLLEALGVGFPLDEDAEGDAIDPAARYRLDPEQGPRRLLSDRGHEERSRAATGLALLALASDTRPSADDLASLRLPLRAVLSHHLGPRGLKSWEMIGDLGRLRRASEPRAG